MKWENLKKIYCSETVIENVSGFYSVEQKTHTHLKIQSILGDNFQLILRFTNLEFYSEDNYFNVIDSQVAYG